MAKKRTRSNPAATLIDRLIDDALTEHRVELHPAAIQTVTNVIFEEKIEDYIRQAIDRLSISQVVVLMDELSRRIEALKEEPPKINAADLTRFDA